MYSTIEIVGDPDDLTLRKVEVDVLVTKKMRDIARAEKCVQEVADFTECCKNTGILMVVKCRNENSALKSCLTRWYEDEDFKNRCKQEYLQERSEFRRTGIPLKERQRVGASM